MLADITMVAGLALFAILTASVVRLSSRAQRALDELTPLIRKLDALTARADRAADQTDAFFNAVEDIGRQTQQVRRWIFGERRKTLANIVGLVAGVRAASEVLLQRIGRQGGHNGHAD
jgi:hypothetical protein